MTVDADVLRTIKKWCCWGGMGLIAASCAIWFPPDQVPAWSHVIEMAGVYVFGAGFVLHCIGA